MGFARSVAGEFSSPTGSASRNWLPRGPLPFPPVQAASEFYIDTSTYVAHRQLESFVDKFGPEHLVFGSRLPLYTAGAALAVLATARISDEARLSIAGGTLRRLLGRESP